MSRPRPNDLPDIMTRARDDRDRLIAAVLSHLFCRGAQQG